MLPLTLLLSAWAGPSEPDSAWPDPRSRVPYHTALQLGGWVGRGSGGGLSMSNTAGKSWSVESELRATGLAGAGLHLGVAGHPLANGLHGPYLEAGLAVHELARSPRPGGYAEAGWRGIWHPGFGYGFSVQYAADTRTAVMWAVGTELSIAFAPRNDHRGFRGPGLKPEHAYPLALGAVAATALGALVVVAAQGEPLFTL